MIITVGNPFREDDGVGHYIYDHLEGKLESKVYHTDQNPSIGINYVEENRPERLIFIDAADFGGTCGESRLIEVDTKKDIFLSTHEMPIPFIGEAIRRDYGCEVYYLGIQVKRVGFGERLSEEVVKGADEIISDCLEN